MAGVNPLAYTMYLAGRTKREANSMHPKNHGQVIPNADTLAFFEAEEAKVAERARNMAEKKKASNAAAAKILPESAGKEPELCGDYLTIGERCKNNCPGYKTTKEKCNNNCPGYGKFTWKCLSAGGRRTRKQNHRNKHKTRKQSRRRYRRDF